MPNRHRQGPHFTIRMVIGICLVECGSNWRRRRPCPTYAGQDHRRPALRSKRLWSCRVFRLALKGLFGRRSKNERLSCSDKEVLALTCINRSECLNRDPGSASWYSSITEEKMSKKDFFTSRSQSYKGSSCLYAWLLLLIPGSRPKTSCPLSSGLLHLQRSPKVTRAVSANIRLRACCNYGHYHKKYSSQLKTEKCQKQVDKLWIVLNQSYDSKHALC